MKATQKNRFRLRPTRATIGVVTITVVGLTVLGAGVCIAQQPPSGGDQYDDTVPPTRPIYSTQRIQPSEETRAKVDSLISSIIEPELSIDLQQNRSKLVRTTRPITRFSITNPEVLDVDQVSPAEFELIAGTPGHTTLTIWFGGDGEAESILRYLVRVSADSAIEGQRELLYKRLQDRLNELFPNSMIQLFPISNKLIVRGQARDAEEAAQILAIIRGSGSATTGDEYGSGVVAAGVAAVPAYSGTAQFQDQLISLLEVPGEMQVMVKVRIAELSRTAMREMGTDLAVQTGDFELASLLAGDVAGVARAVLDTDEVQLTLAALSSNAYSKVLAEPNLVTLSGQPASFIAGGQFAVPTIVGIDGVGAATTQFRGFGTQLTVLPTVIDKDRIRMQVTPSLSAINGDNQVNEIPGLTIRAASTTVDLREGQWLAIAGLLQDEQTGAKTRIPFIGDVPILGEFFSHKEVTRNETELIILVSPELVHPLEAVEVPLILPGMEVTEPGDCDFFLLGNYEGKPHCDHRSTVWPIHKRRITEARFEALLHEKCQVRYQANDAYYIQGPGGFSR